MKRAREEEEEEDDKFDFLCLVPEIQAHVGRACDNSTRMSLYLTCRELYFTPLHTIMPSRPRMAWRVFAMWCMRDGHVNLVDYAITDLQMPKAYFSVFIRDIIDLGYEDIYNLLGNTSNCPLPPYQTDVDRIK